MKSTLSSILLTLFLLLSLCLSGAAVANDSTEAGKGVFHFGTAVNPRGETFYVDSRGILLNGKPILPVMGEMHYVRILHKEGVVYMVPRGWKVSGLTIDNASVQPFCQEREGRLLYFITISGRDPQLTIDGKIYEPKLDKRIYVENVFGKKTGITVLSQEKAKEAFKIDGCLHYAKKGGVLYKAGSRIVEKDFLHASVWGITLSPDIQEKDVADDLFLKITYQGDVARVYADGLSVEDNFWNGNPMMARVSDQEGKQVELKILSLSQDDYLSAGTLSRHSEKILWSSPQLGRNHNGGTMYFLDFNVWYVGRMS